MAIPIKAAMIRLPSTWPHLTPLIFASQVAPEYAQEAEERFKRLAEAYEVGSMNVPGKDPVAVAEFGASSPLILTQTCGLLGFAR